MTRLAVVVRPPGEVAQVLRDLPRPAAPAVVWAGPERWTVRLRPLGHVDPALVDPLVNALHAELAGAAPVLCRLGPATERLADWLGVPVQGLDDLSAAVFDATVGLVPVTHPQPFRGSLVLARGPVPADLGGRPVRVEWQCDRVHLVADRSAPRRPRLDDVGVVPLSGV